MQEQQRLIRSTSKVIRGFAAVALAAALALYGSPAAAQGALQAGCYRADRPLGTSVSADGVPGPIGERIGEAGPALRTLATFRLLDGIRVERPGTVMQKSWARGSGWHTEGDTLHVRLSTGLAGWDLQLVPVPGAGDSVYVGEARYLSDVIVADTTDRPGRVRVRVTREPCAPPM